MKVIKIKNAGFSQTLQSFFLTSFSSKKQRKRGLRLIYHLTFLRTCCKDTTFSCNTKLFLSFFFSKKRKLIKYPPVFILFCNIRSKNKAKRLNFMTILLFSLFERFAVCDNEEDCARQQLKICPIICITFLSIQIKAAISNDDCFHL